MQHAVAASHDEIGQLQATAQALREELERLRIDKEESVQRAVAASHDEIGQLRETIAALRAQLENALAVR